jgi:hypothetical protein
MMGVHGGEGMTEWLDIRAVCKTAGASRKTVYHWFKIGLRRATINRKVLIKRQWLNEFIEAHEDRNSVADKIVASLISR